MREVLRFKPFRLLVFGLTLANLADSLMYLTLGIWIMDLTGSSALAGLVFLALGVRALAFPVIGALTDHFPRKRVLALTCTVAAVGIIPLTMVRDESDIWLIFAAAVLIGLVIALIGAAQAALVRSLLVDEQLAAGNSVVRILDDGLRLLSPIVGAALFSVGGGDLLVAVNAAAFVAAAFAITLVPVEEENAPSHQPAPSASSSGLAHLWGVPPLRLMTLALAASLAVIGFNESAQFAVVDEGLGRPPTTMGPLLAFQGAGSIAAGLLVPRAIGKMGEVKAAAAGLALYALGSVLLLSTTLVVVAVGFVVLGLGIPAIAVAWITLRQRLTPPDLQGRVAAAGDAVLVFPQMASVGVGAWLIGIIGYEQVITALFTVLGIISLSLALSAGRVVREAGDPHTASA